MIFNEDDSSIHSLDVELTKLILECDKISNGMTLTKSHATKRVQEIYSLRNVRAQNMKISEFCIKLKEIRHLFKKTNSELELLLRMTTSENISFNLTDSLKTTLKYYAGTDPWNFWLQEQNYLTEIEEINNIFLHKYHNNKLNNYDSLPKIGEFVCFLERRRISRGMVTQHLSADRLMIVNIDTSSYKVLNQDQVYKVDADISILHAQAIKCSLCEDFEGYTMWSSELGNIFSSILRDGKLEVKVCKQLSDHPPHFLVDIVIKSEGVKDLNVRQWICQIVVPELKQKYVKGVELCHLLSAKALDPYYEEDLDVKTSDGFRVTEDINAKYNKLVPIVRPHSGDNATNQQVASDIQAKSSITKDKVMRVGKDISSQTFAYVEKTVNSISLNLTHDLNDLITKVQNSDELITSNMYCGQTEEYNECKQMNNMNEHTLTRECGIIQNLYEREEKRLSNGYVNQNESNNKAEVDLENTFSTKLFIHDHQKDVSVEHQNPTESNSIKPHSVLQSAQKQEHHYQKPFNSQNQFLNDKNNFPETTLTSNKRVVSPEICKSEKDMSHINNQFSNDENNQSHVTVINQMEESTLIEKYASNQLPSNFVSTKEEMITNQFSFSTRKDSEDNHIILKRPTTTYNSLEICGIMIAHVVTPSDFYVHIANENNANIDWLKEEMYAFYSTIKQNETTHRENVKKMCGTFCACKWPEDENWYRAEVLDWNKDGLVSVFFVDYGNQDVVPLCNIQPLVKKFGNLEMMAQACHLAEIKPISDSWTAAAIECFSKFITDNTIYRLNTVPSKSDKISWALRIFLDEKVDKIDTINDLMVSYGHALNVVNGVRTTNLEKSNQNNSVGSSAYNGEDWDEFDPLAEDFYSSQNCYNIDREDAHTAVTGYKDKDISNVCKFFAKEGKCWKKVCYKKHILESDLTQINMYKEAFEDLSLPNSGALIKLRLVDICSIEKFYVQIEDLDYVGDDERETLVSLINRMNSVESFRSMKPLDAPPIVGQIVIVLSSNKNWFRSRVLEYFSETKSVQVQHVDFGTKENVNERNLCQIEPKYLHLPFQAVECNMANISQHADEAKNKKAVMILENFMGRMLNASVYKSFPGMNRLEVFLLDKDNQDIGNFLLEKKLCMPKLLSNPAFENG